MSKFVDEVNEIVPAIRDTENEVETRSMREVDPFFVLKKTLFSFFENMLKKVQEEDEFKRKVKQALLEKIDSNEVTFPQLSNLLGALESNNLSLTDSILSIFKPVPGTGEVSPLINPKIKQEENAAAFENLSSEERDSLDKMAKLLEYAAKEQANAKKDGDGVDNPST